MDVLFAGGGAGDAAALADLRAAVATSPNDPAPLLALGAALASSDPGAAVDCYLGVVEKGAPAQVADGKTALLKLLSSLGPAHPVSVRGRKALSKLLFR